MALIGAILVEIKIIEILCERSLHEGDRQALGPSIQHVPNRYFTKRKRPCVLLGTCFLFIILDILL